MKPFHALNSVNKETDGMRFSVEFLNSIEIHGLPPNTLYLTESMPIMPHRNCNPPKLCYGTRLIITSF